MDKSKFKIRRATLKDVGTVVDLRRKLDIFELSFNRLHRAPSRVELMRQTPGYIKDKNFFFFIAEVDDKPVGFAAASIKVNNHTKKKKGSLDAVWVEPEHRKQGIAQALTKARLEQLSKYTLEKISVYIRPDNSPSQENIKGFGGTHTYNVYEIKPKKKYKNG